MSRRLVKHLRENPLTAVLYATSLTAALCVLVRVVDTRPGIFFGRGPRVHVTGMTLLDLVWLAVLAGTTRPVFSRVRRRTQARGRAGQIPIRCVAGAWWDVLAMFVSDRRRAEFRFDAITGIYNDLAGITKNRWEDTAEGDDWIVNVRPGYGVTSAQIATREWEGKLHDAAGAICKGVRIDNLDEGGKVRIAFVYRDPLARAKSLPPPVAERDAGGAFAATDITEPVELGRDVRGRKVRTIIWKRNLLLGGLTDHGKSNILNVVAAHVVLATNAIGDGVDLKGGVEFALLHGALEHIATDPATADVLVRRYVALCDERTARLAASHLLQHRPTPDDPARVLLIDEFSRLDAGTQELLFDVMQRGRACSISVIAATPRPSSRLMDTDTRSLFHDRIAVRCRDKTESNIILGGEMSNLGYDASTLRRPGEFLIVSDESRPVRCLAYLLGVKTRLAIAAQTGRFLVESTPESGSGRSALSDQDMNTGGDAEADRQTGPPEGASETAPTGPELAAGSPRAKVWAALTAAPDGLGFNEVVEAAKVSRDTVTKALRAWQQPDANGRIWCRQRHARYHAEMGDAAAETTPASADLAS